MEAYYKITGLNEGRSIEPYAVTQDGLDWALQCVGDMSRRHERISKEEYDELMAEEGVFDDES